MRQLIYISSILLAFSCKTTNISTSLNSSKIDRHILSAGVWEVPPANKDELNICSYNIQFIGQSDTRKNDEIADIIKNCHVVIVQELVAAPENMTFDILKDYTEETKPKSVKNFNDKWAIEMDDESKAFFDSILALKDDSGNTLFKEKISKYDTGSTAFLSNGSGSEYFTVFYQEQIMELDDSLPNGFLDYHDQLAGNLKYMRVPYIHSFKLKNEPFDFSIVNVHLHFHFKNATTREQAIERFVELEKIHKSDPKVQYPINYTKFNEEQSRMTTMLLNQFQRHVELSAIINWIEDYKNKNNQWMNKLLTVQFDNTNDYNRREKNFFIMGDMNISSAEEIKFHTDRLPMISLNPDCSGTTSNMENCYSQILIYKEAEQNINIQSYNVLNTICREDLIKRNMLSNPPSDSQCHHISSNDYMENSPTLVNLTKGKDSQKTFWNRIRNEYSDHNMIFFKIKIPETDID